MSTLSGKDLLELLDFVSPDREQDPDQLECEVTLFHRDSPFTSTDGEDHPAGLYAYLTEYPEEGIFGPVGGPVSHEETDTTLSCDQVVKLKSALTWLGHSTPESLEECAAKQKSLVLALIREVEGLKKEMNSPARLMQLDPAELDTVRQWFDSVHDVTPAYLQQRDYELAKRIYERLGWRVPESIKGGANAVLPAPR
ncbi:hypothetical protein LZT27_14645 [Aeromonas veronii]|uniref:hypothetical protein n=1 Tax=Aeromonas veronii TaxID=654 RepID=UPI0023638754|nr:hypothetical protein [Aeromonas veronii]MDD1845829.1 hypothetical protein [Aeromonas veronii]